MLHRKSRRRIGALSQDLADEKATEDMLTAAVFSRISYLSESIFSELMAALLDHHFVTSAGNLRGVRFWPNLKIDGGRTEPDLVLEFDQSCLVVEVKRNDGVSQQKPAQLYEQWLCALRRYPQMQIVQLAVGGFPKGFQMGKVEEAPFVGDQRQTLYACTWAAIGAVGDKLASRCCASDARILGDLLEALQFHQVLPALLVEITDIQPAGIECGGFEPFEPRVSKVVDEVPLSMVEACGISKHPILRSL